MPAINRRNAVKQFVIVAGGVIILPQWMVSCGESDTITHQTSFSLPEQKLLASITDTIIPAGNSVGALAVGVDKFLQKLIDDCYEKDAQENVKAQLRSLNTIAEQKYKRPFTKCTQKEKEELLLKLSTSESKAEKDFFTLIKSETIRGFNTSQKVMQEFLGYQVAPGHYYGCVDVKPTDHA